MAILGLRAMFIYSEEKDSYSKRVEKMPIELPVAISALGYKTLWEFLIEFGIISSLFGMAFKQSLSVVNGLQESMRKKEFGDMASNVFGSHQYKQSSNMFGLMLGIGCAYILMFKYEVTLGTVADNGIAAGFFSLCAGAFAHAWLSARLGPNKWPWSIGGAALVATCLFAVFIGRTTLGPQLFYSIVPMISFGLFILAMITVGDRAAGAAAGTSPPPGLPGITPSPPSGTALVPSGPAGTPVAAQNAEDLTARVGALIDQKLAGITDLGKKVDDLKTQFGLAEQQARKTADSIDAALKAAEAGSPNAAAKAVEAADKIDKLAQAASTTSNATSVVITSATNAVDDRPIVAAQADAEQVVADFEQAVFTLETEVARDPNNAPVVEKLEGAKDGAKRAEIILHAGSGTLSQQISVVRTTVEHDVEQIERWRTEAQPVVDELKQIAAAVRMEAKSSTPRLNVIRELLKKTQELRDRLGQILQEHSVDADTIKQLSAGLSFLFKKRGDAVDEATKLLGHSKKELSVIVAKLLPPAETEKIAESEKAESVAAHELAQIEKNLTVLVNLLDAIKQTRFDKLSGNALQKWFSEAWGAFYGKLNDSLVELTSVERDLQGLLKGFGYEIAETDQKKIEEAIQIIGVVLGKEMRLKPIADSIERLRKEGKGEDQKQVQRFMAGFQSVSTDELKSLIAQLKAEVRVIAAAKPRLRKAA